MQRFISNILVLGLLLFTRTVLGVSVPDDYATIQAAVDAVKQGHLPPGTTIYVSPGVYTESVRYAETNHSFALISTDGSENTIIDSTGLGFPGILIRDTTAAIEISGFTITGGDVQNGGGVLFSNASPSLTNCEIRGNSADTGGGIYLYNSVATVSDCVIRENAARIAGGGIAMFNGSQPTLQRIKVLNNSAGNSTLSASGGGIQINDSSPDIIDSQINSNSATFAGGGIFLIGKYDSIHGSAHLNLSRSHVNNNNVTPATEASLLVEGGGLHIEDNASASVNDSVIAFNVAEQGGGISVFRGGVTVLRSVLEGNESPSGAGGGIHGFSDINGASVVTLLDSIIRNNIARNGGGASVVGNDCTGVGPCAQISIINSLISENTSSYYGGGLNISDAILDMADSSVLGNTCVTEDLQGQGGGLRLIASQVAIDDSVIADNRAGQFGGGMFLENASTLSMQRTYVYGNSVNFTSGGGGIHVGGNGPPSGTVSDSIIADNVPFQLREQTCPLQGIPAPFLTYTSNTITSQGIPAIYVSPCSPPGEILDIDTFNELDTGGRTAWNVDTEPTFAFLNSLLLPWGGSTLYWAQSRTSLVDISGLGLRPGPSGMIDVHPACDREYSLGGDAVLVTGNNKQDYVLRDTTLNTAVALEVLVSMTIESVAIPATGDVNVKAAERITLLPPLRVSSGATFHAAIEPTLCQ